MIELNRIYNEDCLETMKRMEDCSVDSIVTDPPAGISFMGKEWDHHKGGRDEWIGWMSGIASECLRVLKPGAHALVWSLPRTSHWTATAWENAGFEVRDRIGHIFGSGFPKSLDVSKAIDKNTGHWRGRAGRVVINEQPSKGKEYERAVKGDPITAAAAWSGWGTALKPAVEDWWVLRKPLVGTVAENVLEYGVGALNIDASRIETNESPCEGNTERSESIGYGSSTWQKSGTTPSKGRWPVHLIHDGSEEVVAVFPITQSGVMKAGTQRSQGGGYHGHFPGEATGHDTPAGFGSASRFFYCAKADREERNRGLEGMGKQEVRWSSGTQSPGTFQAKGTDRFVRNHHPTVKPLALMEYLVRLITPPNGIVFDPFAGSGTTCLACIRQGFQFVASEKESDYCAIAQKRIDAERAQMKLAL